MDREEGIDAGRSRGGEELCDHCVNQDRKVRAPIRVREITC